MTKPATAVADRDSNRAAIVLGLTLPADVVLYLLLPMYAADFGVTLFQAGVLLAANRLVRIVGYGAVARLYAARGDRLICLWATVAAAVCALGYAFASGFWILLVLRLLWGMSFAALNLSTQTLSTAAITGAAGRTGRSRALIATGPMIALPLGALLAQQVGPRAIFYVLTLVALAGLAFAYRLPEDSHGVRPATRRKLKLPNSLDAWSFVEGLVLDGLFIIGLSYLGKDLMPGSAVLAAGGLLAARYGAEILLSPLGGRLADRWGAERMLVGSSLLTAAALVGFGAGFLFGCAFLIVVLRALQLPLLPPIVAKRNPGAGRVQALAARAVWRDIGAGTGPLMAGLLLPIAAPIWIYGVSAALLSVTALASWRPADGEVIAEAGKPESG